MAEEKQNKKTEGHNKREEKKKEIEEKVETVVEKEKTKIESEEIKKEEKKTEEKKTEQKETKEKKQAQKVKKTEAIVNVPSLSLSVKTSGAICRFIKYKEIDKAIEDLEQVLKYKKVIPMRGEIPHRKGKGIMAGRFPQNASKDFIMLLKSLKANAENHEVEDPVIIVEAYANKTFRPYGRFGRIQHKRASIFIRAMNKKMWYDLRNKKKNKNKKINKTGEKKK